MHNHEDGLKINSAQIIAVYDRLFYKEFEILPPLGGQFALF